MRLSALLIALSLPGPVRADQVTVFAAASLGSALDEVAARFEAQTGHDVVLAYAGSGALAQQILNGAPADIFISASANWMDAVQAQGLIVPDARVDLLGNSLVLIGPLGAAPVDIGPDIDLVGMLAGGRLAMGLVDSVPAGQYGKAALTHLDLWNQVEPHVAQADNVRAALALVARGEAPLGVVYATDAAAEPAVSVLGTFPADSHDPITYPAGLLTDSAAAIGFFAALQSAPSRATFAAHGFTTLSEGE